MKRLCIVVAAAISAGCATPSQYPDPLTAGWEGARPCELLHEDAAQRILRCTFAPSTGHERHFHNEHFAYVLAGSRLSVTDADGTREADYATGISVMNDAIDWHEAINIGDTTAVFLIVEAK